MAKKEKQNIKDKSECVDLYVKFVEELNGYYRKDIYFCSNIDVFDRELQMNIWIKRINNLVLSFNYYLTKNDKEIKSYGVNVDKNFDNLNFDYKDLEDCTNTYYTIMEAFMSVITQLDIKLEVEGIKVITESLDRLSDYINKNYKSLLNDLGVTFDLLKHRVVYYH